MERRRHPRFPVRFLVQHHEGVDDAYEVDYARDMSRGGLFIETTRTFAPLTTLHVQFAPNKDAQLVSAFCRVTRITPGGVGAEFIAIDSESLTLMGVAD
jgi:hypothetical protein